MSFDPVARTGRAGVTVATENGACDGPFYIDARGMATLGSATDGESGAFAFINCPPGHAVVRATLSGTTCRALDTKATAIELEMLADRLTFIGRVVCD